VGKGLIRDPLSNLAAPNQNADLKHDMQPYSESIHCQRARVVRDVLLLDQILLKWLASSALNILEGVAIP